MATNTKNAKVDAAETPVAVPAPAPDVILTCHAMVRSDGGWRRFEFEIPESVAARYVTVVSDVDAFGTHQRKLEHALYLQRERG